MRASSSGETPTSCAASTGYASFAETGVRISWSSRPRPGLAKSSFLRAGLWPRLDRDPDVALLGILRPATGILTGPEGLGRELAKKLSRPDHPINPGDVHAQLLVSDIETAAAALRRWIGLVVDQARERRRISDKDARTPALLLAVDQAEELLSAEDETEAIDSSRCSRSCCVTRPLALTFSRS